MKMDPMCGFYTRCLHIAHELIKNKFFRFWKSKIKMENDGNTQQVGLYLWEEKRVNT